jgi:hypothetical protein
MDQRPAIGNNATDRLLARLLDSDFGRLRPDLARQIAEQATREPAIKEPELVSGK